MNRLYYQNISVKMEDEFSTRVLSGVNPAWIKLILENLELYGHFVGAMDSLKAIDSSEPVEPAPGTILECMRYCSPKDVRVVIIGQDPYLGGKARGLSFAMSTRQDMSPSLKNILAAVNKRLGPGETPQSSDLRPWAAQGVLLLNRALTVGRTSGSHFKIWNGFTDTLISTLCRNSTRPMAFMLWGKKAQEIKWSIFNSAKGGTVKVFERGHPSPVSDNKLPANERFATTRDFDLVNEFLTRAPSGGRAIQWTPTKTRAASDGACIRNGKSDARGSFSVLVGSGPLAGHGMTGVVAESTYKFIDENNPLRGFRPTGEHTSVTNNRAEYLGGCCLLLLLLRSGIRGDVEIVFDTKLFVESLLSWLPKRRKEGTMGEMKNLDLLLIAEALHKNLSAQCNKLDIIHIKSHQKEPVGGDLIQKERWKLNDTVDKRATLCLKNETIKCGKTTFVGGCWIP